MKTVLILFLLSFSVIAQNMLYPEITPTNVEATDDSYFVYIEYKDEVSNSVTLWNIRSLLDETNFTSVFNSRLNSFAETSEIPGLITSNSTVVSNAAHVNGGGSDHADVASNTNKIDGSNVGSEIDSVGIYDYIKAGGGEYVYRPGTIGRLGLALAKSTHTGNYTNVVCIGNSLNSYSLLLKDMLWDAFGNGGLGYVSFGENKYTSPSLATVTTYGTWTDNDLVDAQSEFGIDGNSLASTTPASDSIKVETSVNWRYCRIWYAGGEGTSFDVYIDGASQGTVTTSGSGLQKTAVYDAATVGISDIVIKNVVGNVILYGADYYENGAGSGVILHNLGNGGSKAEDWYDKMSYCRAFIDSVDADLIFVHLGANDASASTDSSVYRMYITAIIDSVQVDKTVPVIAISANKMSSAPTTELLRQYKAVLKDLIRTRGIGYFSIWDMWPSYAVADALGVMGDGTHPNMYGNEAIASALMRTLFYGFQPIIGVGAENYFKTTNHFGADVYVVDGLKLTRTSSGVYPLQVYSGANIYHYIDTGYHWHVREGTRVYFDEDGGNFHLSMSGNMLRLFDGVYGNTWIVDHKQNMGLFSASLTGNSSKGTLYMHDWGDPPNSMPDVNDIALYAEQDQSGVRQLYIMSGDNTISQISGLLGTVIDSVAVSADSLFLYDLDNSRHVAIEWVSD